MSQRLQLFVFRLTHHLRIKAPELPLQPVVVSIQILPGVAQRLENQRLQLLRAGGGKRSEEDKDCSGAQKEM